MKDLGYGVFTFDGKEFALNEDARATEATGAETYEANCLDVEGNELTMFWEITNADTDECYSCDWESPIAVD